jgi:hypothetical protein
MKTNNPIIQQRLNQLMEQKSALLKLKKSKRGNQLTIINQTINRLKQWIQDSGTMIPCSNPVDDILKQRQIDDQCGGSIKEVGFVNKKTGEIVSMDDIPSQTGTPTFTATFKPPGSDFEESTDRMKNAYRKLIADMKINKPQEHDINIQSDKKTPEIDGKPSIMTDKWMDETPDAYKHRIMDVQTAFRKMGGWD